jgi:hypothetical protein
VPVVAPPAVFFDVPADRIAGIIIKCKVVVPHRPRLERTVSFLMHIGAANPGIHIAGDFVENEHIGKTRHIDILPPVADRFRMQRIVELLTVTGNPCNLLRIGRHRWQEETESDADIFLCRTKHKQGKSEQDECRFAFSELTQESGAPIRVTLLLINRRVTCKHQRNVIGW